MNTSLNHDAMTPQMEEQLSNVHRVLMQNHEQSKLILPIWMGCESLNQQERLAHWQTAINNGVDPFVFAKIVCGWGLPNEEAKQDFIQFLPSKIQESFLVYYSNRANHSASSNMISAFLKAGIDPNIQLSISPKEPNQVPWVGLLIGQGHWNDAEEVWQKMNPITPFQASQLTWFLFKGLFMDVLQIEYLSAFRSETDLKQSKSMDYRRSLCQKWIERFLPFNPDFSLGFLANEKDAQAFHLKKNETHLSTQMHFLDRLFETALMTPISQIRETILREMMPLTRHMNWSCLIENGQFHPALLHFLEQFYSFKTKNEPLSDFAQTCLDTIQKITQQVLLGQRPDLILTWLTKTNLKAESIYFVLENLPWTPVHHWKEAGDLFSVIVDAPDLFFGESFQPFQPLIEKAIPLEFLEAWKQQILHAQSFFSLSPEESQMGIQLMKTTWGESPLYTQHKPLRI